MFLLLKPMAAESNLDPNEIKATRTVRQFRNGLDGDWKIKRGRLEKTRKHNITESIWLAGLGVGGDV